jgi:hypothetical protein
MRISSDRVQTCGYARTGYKPREPREEAMLELNSNIGKMMSVVFVVTEDHNSDG